MSEVVHISEHGRFKGARIPSKSDIMEEEKKITPEIEQALKESSASMESSSEGGMTIMDSNTKSYVDDQISSLEKSINRRLDYQEKIFSEKLDHLHTKTEKTIGDKLSDFKDSFERGRKEDRKYMTTISISIAGVAVAVIALFL
ncbi:hypothetical protein [Oceanobacillus caeni]|uniref:hypothetical protein n=1 Tax=Oceanobacillus caeni TaxID=405946 RepID=UPI00362B1A38